MDTTTATLAPRSAETVTAIAAVPPEGQRFPDWGRRFPPSRAVLPLEQDRDFLDLSPAVVRGLFVDLASVAPAAAKRRDPHAALEVHADVIRVAAPVALEVESLVLHARRIEIATGATLSLALPPQKPGGSGTLQIDAGEFAFEDPAAGWRVDFAGVATLIGADDAPGCIRCVYDSAVPPPAEAPPEDDRKPVAPPAREHLYPVLLAARLQEIAEQAASAETLFRRRMVQRQRKDETRVPLIAAHDAEVAARAGEQARCEKLRLDRSVLDESVFEPWNAVYGRYATTLQACRSALRALQARGMAPASESLQLNAADRQFLDRLQAVEPEAHDVHAAIGALLDDHRLALEAVSGLAAQAADDRLGGTHAVRRTRSPRCTPGDAMQGEFALQTAKCLQYAGGADPAPARQLAVDVARWINRCHAQPEGDARLAVESALLLERVLGTGHALRYVPQLQFKEYFDLAVITADALQDVERHADCFFDRDEEIADRKAAATEMLAHYGNAKGLSEQLRQQAQDERDVARQAHEASAAKLKLLSAEMDGLHKAFEQGVEKKKAELEKQAIFAIVGAVVVLGIGIAQACMGNPAAAGEAAQQAGKAAENIGKMAQLMQKVAKAMQMVGKLLLKLVDVEKVLKAMGGAYQGYAAYKDYTRTQAITVKANELGFEQQLEPGDEMTAADWDAFTVEMRSLFAQPVRAEIEGAAEYLCGLEKLAVRSKDVLDTALHLARCQQVCLQREWGGQRDERDIALAKDRVDQLGAHVGPDFTMLVFCERLAHQLKFQLMDAIGNAADAFRYHALREADFRPSMEDSGARLHQLVARAKEADLLARESFRSPPADWGPQTCRIWSHDALAELRATRRLSWTISNHSFRGYERIRIREIRVWLIPNAPLHRDVKVAIRTSGIYRDRWKGEMLEFRTEPLERTFTYRPMRQGIVRNHRGDPVEMNAQADDIEHAYFEPTPFTTWEITLPEDLNPSLDLAAITEVGLEFRGSYIGAASGERAAAVKLQAAAPAGAAAFDLTLL